MLATLVAFAFQSTLPFVDQGPQDPNFVAYRNNFLRALKNKDVKGIKARIADDVVFSVGDPEAQGEAAMFRQFSRGDGLVSLYHEIEAVLNLGGYFTESGFWAPYTYHGWPEDVDPFEYAYVVVPRAGLYDKPKGKVIGSIGGFAQVKLEQTDVELPRGWMKIVAPDIAANVYARNSEIRSNADYRGLFEKRNGVYQMAFFAAGD
jgi:hypothetical protein